ncbi:MAG: cation-transporting P-type ATPase [Actinobacteria bacterium]|nr:cation-transporting P-type ATPase [Actinomycetota bacterium]
MSQSSPVLTAEKTPVAAPWALPPHEVVSQLDTDVSDGLTSAEAIARAAVYGPNRLAEKPAIPIWKRFVEQFRSVLILLLAIGAAAAAAVGDLKDAIVIASVLVINAILGTVQEARAENSLGALKAMLSANARVKRDGSIHDIEASELVPGDIVLLEAGDRIPADARILVSHDGEADESSLTGESLAVNKGTAPAKAADVPLGDRSAMVWMNTTVTRGRVEAVVTATGMSTEMGRIADLLTTTDDTETPLARQLDGLGKRLAVVAGFAMVLYLAVGMARGDALKEIIGSAIGLAIAAVPEGLPAVVTVTLALGVSHVAKHGAIVKNLASVETLGSTSVICSDKTGTLTMNRMAAVELQIGGQRHEVTLDGQSPTIEGLSTEDPTVRDLLQLAVLSSDAVVTLGDTPREVGDPTEVGIVRLASQIGIDGEALRRERPRIAEVPFDSGRKYMVAIVDESNVAGSVAGEVRFAVKGAVDRLIGRCSAIRVEGRTVTLTEDLRDAVAATVDGAARQGRRVLAICTTTAPTNAIEGANLDRLIELSRELELVGLVGLADPPRPEAAEAIREAQGAGISLKMITGDHPTTATAIAHEIGIVGETISGAELDEWSDEHLTERVEDIGVFARVSPEHKLRIVRSLQARGNVTAMTGDGVNDAPSLKQADVGVAMGITGTEVSKEAADVVLADDQLGSIVKAVGQGRAIYDNIVTFVRFQVATNIGAILTLVGSQLIGLPKPFAAIQLLWINIIMDGPPAMALGTDKPKPGVMKRKPRKPNDPILSKNRLAIIGLHGSIMAAVTLGILAYGKNEWSDAIGATMAFTVFVLFQIVNALNVRSVGTLFQRQTLTNKVLWGALGLVSVLQILVVEVDWMNDLFETVDLNLGQWGICVAGALTLFVVDEIRRVIAAKRGVLD